MTFGEDFYKYPDMTKKRQRPQINLAADPKDIKLFKEAASKLGLNLSSWIRMVALQAAKEQTGADQ